MNRILAGLQIIAIYDPHFMTGAEHDEFYVYWSNSDKEMSDEDVERMKNLGWRFDDANSGWCIFT